MEGLPAISDLDHLGRKTCRPHQGDYAVSIRLHRAIAVKVTLTDHDVTRFVFADRVSIVTHGVFDQTDLRDLFHHNPAFSA
jgi:hypothetical protein